MARTAALPELAELLKDPAAPYWAQAIAADAWRHSRRNGLGYAHDPVDIASALDVLAEAFRARAEEIVAELVADFGERRA